MTWPAARILLAAVVLLLFASGPATAQKPKLNTLRDVGRALGECWVPPPLEKSRPGTEITVLITFNRNGDIMGEPRFTYMTPGISRETRTAYQLSVGDALTRCAPLSFTPELGGAVAGRPFAMRYVDTRGQKGA
jgi:hypothetical protein